jgi:hypothetical protein
MKAILLGGGVVLLLFGLLLLVIALVMYFIGRNKQAAPAGQHRPPMPPQPPQAARPPQVARPLQAPPPPPGAPQPAGNATLPPPPPAPPIAPRPAAPPPPPTPGAGDTDATVVAERMTFGSLHATAGPLAGQTFPLKAEGYYIGRDRTLSQIVLETPSVSKRHVWVGVKDGVATVVDQGSTNGTYLNTLGTRIGTVRLTPGDTLIISDDVARFVYKA